jgi:hypothetical protein
MNKILLALAFFFIPIVSAHASSCDKCGKRTIAFYDPAVLIPRPTGTDSALKYSVPRWWRLFSITIPARAALRSSDPTFDCIIAYDGALLAGNSGAFTDTLTFGVEHASVAPSGPIATSDYIFTGSSSGTESNITLNLRIEAARTRELVLSGSASFTDMINASDIAQQLALGSLSPIAQKIRDWEKKKRDTDPDVTINGEEITVTPVKQAIKTNETVLVRFEYKDCDGVPLKGKKLYFNGVMIDGMSTGASTLGRFEKDSMLTDDDGKAEMTFIPSGVKGIATLVVCNVYKFPFGATGAADGHATLFIDTPPVAVWKMSGSVSTLYQKSVNEQTSGFGGSSKYISTENFVGNAKYSQLVIDETNRPGEFHFYGTQLLSKIVRGSYSETDNLTDEEKGPKGLSYAEYRYDQYSGAPVLDDFSIVARYNGKDSYVQIDAPFYRNGVYGAKEWIQQDDGSYGWSNWSDDMHDQVSGAYAQWYQGEATGSFIKTDSGFIANGNKITTTEEPQNGSSATTTEQFSLVVSPSSFVTKAGAHEQHTGLPLTPVLYPNYPNPFNPSTTIRFFVPVKSRVRLEVFNILGQYVVTLADDVHEAGFHWQTWNAAVSSGIYCCRMISESMADHRISSSIQSMMLVR